MHSYKYTFCSRFRLYLDNYKEGIHMTETNSKCLEMGLKIRSVIIDNNNDEKVKE